MSTGPRYRTVIDIEMAVRNLCQLFPSATIAITLVLQRLFSEIKDQDTKFMVPDPNDIGAHSSVMEGYGHAQAAYVQQSEMLYRLLYRIDKQAVDDSHKCVMVGASRRSERVFTAVEGCGVSVIMWLTMYHGQVSILTKAKYQDLMNAMPGLFRKGSIKEGVAKIREHVRGQSCVE